MLAATSAADISPPVGVFTQGHFPDAPSHTLLGPIELRTIVFSQDERRSAIVSLDIIGIERDVTSRIRRQITSLTGIPEDSVMITCSHTHSGPPTITIMGSNPDAEYLGKVEQAAVESVIDACDRLEPATLGLGASAAYFNVNRRPTPKSNGSMAPNTAEIVDRRVRVLRIDNAGGEPMAALFHYTCHPTTMSGSDGYLTPDYPGVARTIVESRFRCKALFIPGCFGNVRPNLVDDKNQFRNATPEELVAIGSQLGDAVAKAVRYTRTFEAKSLCARLREITLQYGDTLPLEELRQITGDTSIRYRQANASWARGVLDLLGRDAMPRNDTSQMQAMRIGPLAIVAIPGEPVLEIGHAVERELTGRIDVDDIWAIGYTNDMLGYLTTKRQKDEGGYEPSAFRYFLRPAAWSREPETIVEAAVALAEDLHE